MPPGRYTGLPLGIRVHPAGSRSLVPAGLEIRGSILLMGAPTSSDSRISVARGALKSDPGSHCSKTRDHSGPLLPFGVFSPTKSCQKPSIQWIRIREGLCLKAVKRTVAGWPRKGLGAKMPGKASGSLTLEPQSDSERRPQTRQEQWELTGVWRTPEPHSDRGLKTRADYPSFRLVSNLCPDIIIPS